MKSYQRRIVSHDLSHGFFWLKEQNIPLLSKEVNLVHPLTKDNILSETIISKEETNNRLNTSTFLQNSRDAENPYVSLNYARNLSFTKNEDSVKKGRHSCLYCSYEERLLLPPLLKYSQLDFLLFYHHQKSKIFRIWAPKSVQIHHRTMTMRVNSVMG